MIGAPEMLLFQEMELELVTVGLHLSIIPAFRRRPTSSKGGSGVQGQTQPWPGLHERSHVRVEGGLLSSLVLFRAQTPVSLPVHWFLALSPSFPRTRSPLLPALSTFTSVLPSEKFEEDEL